MSDSINKNVPYNYVVARDDPASLYYLIKHFKITHFLNKSEGKISPVMDESFDQIKEDMSTFRLKAYYVRKHDFGDHWAIYMLTVFDEEKLEDICFHMFLRDKYKRTEDSFNVNMKSLIKKLSPEH